MRLVILESPYRARTKDEEWRYREYARLALRDCYERGESPTASHLLGPLVLDDADPFERGLGIEAGYEWMKAAECAVFYVDYGMSPGMVLAEENAKAEGLPCEHRTLTWERQNQLRALIAKSTQPKKIPQQ